MSIVHVLTIFLAAVSLSLARPLTADDIVTESLEENDDIGLDDISTLLSPLECNCGNNSICTFVHDGRLECRCIEGYAMYRGNCVGCDCGEHADCKFTNLSGKVCTCQSGYAFKSGRCSSCDCGKDSDCTFDPVNGTKVCDCPKGFGEFKGTCKACDCGTSEANCTFLSGEKECLCPPEFELKGDTCGKKQSTVTVVLASLSGIGSISCAGCHACKDKKETSEKESSETETSEMKTSATETSENGTIALPKKF